MENKSIHPRSVLGRIMATEEAVQAKRQAVLDLVQRRRAELADLQTTLSAVPVDTDDLPAVAGILGQGEALTHLLAETGKEVTRLTGELDKVRERVALLAVSRLDRLEAGIATLADENRAVPGSPVQRRQKLLEDRYRLMLLAGDPDEAARLLQELEVLISDPQRWSRMLMDLVSYKADLLNVAGLPSK